MSRREELIDGAIWWLINERSTAPSPTEKTTEWMADFAHETEKAVIRRIVEKLKQIDHTSDGYDVFSDGVREYMAELEKEVSDAAN